MMYDVVIIGGGASGLTASIECKKRYDKVLLIDKEQKVGKKILVTGNGKCNMTNFDMSAEHYHGSVANSIKEDLENYSPQFIIDYFKDLGLYTYCDNERRVYPLSNQASTVNNVLRIECERQNVEIVSEKVISIKKQGEIYLVNNFKTKTIIIACGGKSSPNNGSDGSLFKVIEATGHKFSPMFPALCPINVSSPIIKSLKGVRAKGTVTVYSGTSKYSEKGEIQFTQTAISGICAFNLSVYDNIDKVTVSLLDNYSYKEILNILQVRKKDYGDLTVDNLLIGLLNNKLGYAILKISGIDKFSTLIKDLTFSQISSIAENIKKMIFKPTINNDFSNSQVTRGGIPLKEINPVTFESKINKGMYFCGEVLDICGDCGGYNLHFAFMSGIKVGRNI